MLKQSNFFWLFLSMVFFLFTSCSSNYQMNLKNCHNNIELGHLNKMKGTPFFLKYKFDQSPIITEDKLIDLNKILKKNNINCEEVKAISIKSIISWDQAILNLLPAYSSHTLLIKGIKK